MPIPPASSNGSMARTQSLEYLLSLFVDVPEDWLVRKDGFEGSLGLPCVPCSSYRQLVQSWRKALKWTDGLDRALSVMLATVTSTKTVGDQLWLKVIGPASSGKSTLCEALSVSRRYVIAKSTIRGFHSGSTVGTKDGKDNSLISKLRDMTLATKDGDTLLQSPNLGQILAEGRDLYDGTSRSHYRNAQGKDYAGVRMTWILCGTNSLRSIDSSELGERFLDCVIMDGVDDDQEDEILWRVANRTDRSLSVESNGKPEGQYDLELSNAMSLTGGYVNYLRQNAARLLAAVEAPEWAMRRCIRLGKFVAYMRARPSRLQDEKAEREFATRLVSQHVKLSKCLSMVLNRPVVDEEVMRRVMRVSMDTARGQTLEIVAYLYGHLDGAEPRAVSLYTNLTDDKTRGLLRFLRDIGVVRLVQPEVAGLRTRSKWQLTNRMRRLYGDVTYEDLRREESHIEVYEPYKLSELRGV